MSKVTVEDKLPQFSKSLKRVLDDAFMSGARDTLIQARSNAPFDKGQLRSESETKKLKPLHWRISFWMEYARFQEFGGDGKRRVRNYKHSGTGKHYLKNAGEEQARKIVRTIKMHAARARA